MTEDDVDLPGGGERPVPPLREFCALDANFVADTDYPVGRLNIPAVSYEGVEVQSVAVVLLCDIGGSLVVLVPQRAWNRLRQQRLIPTATLIRPTQVDLPFVDRSISADSTPTKRRVWLAYLAAQAEQQVVFDPGEVEDPDLLFDGSGPHCLPVPEALARLAEERFGFVSAASGGDGLATTVPSTDLVTRVFHCWREMFSPLQKA